MLEYLASLVLLKVIAKSKYQMGLDNLFCRVSFFREAKNCVCWVGGLPRRYNGMAPHEALKKLCGDNHHVGQALDVGFGGMHNRLTTTIGLACISPPKMAPQLRKLSRR